MKVLKRSCFILAIMLFAISANALTVTFNYDNFRTKLYGRVTEDIKQECCDAEGKTYGYKSINVFASGEGSSKCRTTVKIMAKRTLEPEAADIDILSYLQDHAEGKMNNGDRKGSYKEFFTVTNDGKEASKAYQVSWLLDEIG